MIKVEVKTIFQGRVAIRDRYVNESLANMEDILIVHGSDQMLIPYQIADKYAAKSEYPVRDKYNKNESHYLLYYNWLPTVKQGTML